VVHRLGALHALVSIALAFAYALSFAALIFSGDLGAGFGVGVYSALAAVGIGGLVAAAFSRFNIAIVGPDNNPTAVLALITASLFALPQFERVPTMMAIVVIATALTGAAFIVLGAVRASRVIRFIPEPMVGGFNAASGTLVMLGSVRVLTGHPLRLHSLPLLMTQPVLWQLLLAVGLALALVFCSRRFGAVAIPALFIGAVALSLVTVAALHLPLEQLQADRWFFAMPHAQPWFAWSALRDPIDWSRVVAALPSILIIVVISAATMLVNSTGLELLTAHDVDLDREMRVTGYANLLGALFGGMVSYVSFSRSQLNHHLGRGGRMVGALVALTAILAMIAGPWRVIDYVPVFAPAALLIAIGGSGAHRWLIAGARHRSFGDVLLVWAIVVAVVWQGFVAGIIAGLAIGCVTFVVRYGKIDAVERRWNGSVIHSSLQRSLHETQILTAHGHAIRVFRLRGFIFFGTADRLYRELFACATALEPEAVMWIVVDFTSVTGIDSSAVHAFIKFARNVDADRVQFMLCGMSPKVAAIWNNLLSGDVSPLAFDDLDLALEYCESQLLLLFERHTDAPASLEHWLARQFGAPLAQRICGALERLELDTGDVLCAHGDPADQMFFIESGRVAVLAGEEHFMRLRSIGRHAMIGEMGLYNSMTRTATVVAEMRSVVYALTREALDRIEAEDPLAARAFHAEIVRSLADRLEHQNGVIASMSA
jgi:sulfate permease, SulP family